MKKIFIGFFTVLSVVSFVILAGAEEGPGFVKAEADLRANWAKNYPAEKIISVEKNGDPVVLEKTFKGKVVERKLKYPFSVTIDKSGSERVFEAGANYIQKKNDWLFSEIGVGQVIIKAAKGDEKPSKDKVKEMVLKAFKIKYPDNVYTKVLLDDGEFGKNSKGVFYRYEGDIFKMEGGREIKCKDIMFNISKYTGSADWIVDITVQGSCY